MFTLESSQSPGKVSGIWPSGPGWGVEPPQALDAPTALTAQEQVLVLALRAGDSGAANPLYAELRPSIDRGLMRVLRRRSDDFEDLVQQAFERVVRSVTEHRFRGESRLTTWAYVIAVHVATDWLRKLSLERLWLEPVDQAELDERSLARSVEQQLEARSEVRRVAGILRRMNSTNARALVLHDVCHHTVPEVARILHLSESATASRLRRARMELARRRDKRVATGDSVAELQSSV